MQARTTLPRVNERPCFGDAAVVFFPRHTRIVPVPQDVPLAITEYPSRSVVCIAMNVDVSHRSCKFTYCYRLYWALLSVAQYVQRCSGLAIEDVDGTMITSAHNGLCTVREVDLSG